MQINSFLQEIYNRNNLLLDVDNEGYIIKRLHDNSIVARGDWNFVCGFAATIENL